MSEAVIVKRVSPRENRILRSLQYKDYQLWFIGSLVSNLGTWMQRTAQDWLVLTQLTQHNSLALGIITGLQYGPQFLLLPVTGYVADRFDRRHVLFVTQSAMGLVSLILGLLTILGSVRLWEVDILALLFGAASAFDAPVRQTFVNELVPQAALSNAIALNSASFNAARMIGPGIAGLCIGSVGTGAAFLANGFSFLMILIVLLPLRNRQLSRVGTARGTTNLFEGFRYVAREPSLSSTAIMLFLFSTFGLNFPIFISTMAVGVFKTDAMHYGMLSTALASGTLLGAFLAARRETPRFNILTRASGFFGLGCLAAALAPNYWSFAAVLALTGIAILSFTNTSNSLMQLSSVPEMRGRVMAIRLAIALGGTPIGAPFVGWVAQDFGPRWALGIGAMAGLAAMLIGWRQGRARPTVGFPVFDSPRP